MLSDKFPISKKPAENFILKGKEPTEKRTNKSKRQATSEANLCTKSSLIILPSLPYIVLEAS